MTHLVFAAVVCAGGLITYGASTHWLEPVHVWESLGHALSMIGILCFILAAPAKRDSRFPRAFAWVSSWTRTRTVLVLLFLAGMGYAVTWTRVPRSEAHLGDTSLLWLALGLSLSAFLALLVLREHWVEFSPEGVEYGGRWWPTERVGSPPVNVEVGDSHAVITTADGRTRSVLRDPLMSHDRWRAQWVEMEQFLESSRSAQASSGH